MKCNNEVFTIALESLRQHRRMWLMMIWRRKENDTKARYQTNSMTNNPFHTRIQQLLPELKQSDQDKDSIMKQNIRKSTTQEHYTPKYGNDFGSISWVLCVWLWSYFVSTLQLTDTLIFLIFMSISSRTSWKLHLRGKRKEYLLLLFWAIRLNMSNNWSTS